MIVQHPIRFFGGLVALCLALAGNESTGGIALGAGSAKDSFRGQSQWKLVFANDGEGARLGGTLAQVQASAAQGDPLGVLWASWHGELSAPCEKVTVDKAGTVRCEFEFQCQGSQPGLPRGHVHRIQVATDGSFTGAILEHGEDRWTLKGRESGGSGILWYGPRGPERSARNDGRTRRP